MHDVQNQSFIPHTHTVPSYMLTQFSLLTNVLHDLSHEVSSPRCHLAWFTHHGTPGSQRRGNFERQEVDWQVPWRYQSGHTHWRPAGVVSGLNLRQNCRPAEYSVCVKVQYALFNYYCVCNYYRVYVSSTIHVLYSNVCANGIKSSLV